MLLLALFMLLLLVGNTNSGVSIGDLEMKEDSVVNGAATLREQGVD
jgi:hypothetical protein